MTGYAGARPTEWPLLTLCLTKLGIAPNTVSMPKKTEKQVWVRMPMELCKRIETMAEAEDRTFSSMVRVLCDEALDAREKGEKR